MSKFTDFDNFSDYSDDGKLLYVDILNFGEFFFPVREQWSVTSSYQYAKKFIAACKNSGWNITLFISDTTPSVDSLSVWKSRRALEIDKGQKNMPIGMAVLIGDMFKAEGIPIIYSDEGVSNHDMLASYAEADGASILSDDKKFCAFEGSTFTVYGGYSIKNGELKLRRKQEDAIWKPADTRTIPAKPTTLPKESPSGIFSGGIQRGTATPLTKALGIDLHSIVTPLRLAAHASHGVQGPLVELWPYWDLDSKSVGWHQETVFPSASAEMMALLNNPDAAVTHFFGRYLTANKPEEVKWHDWQKHLHCMRGLVYEMCATSDRSLLSMWLKYEAKNPIRMASSSAHNHINRGGTAGGRSGSGRGNNPGCRGDTGRPAYVRNMNISCHFYEER